MNYLIDYGYLSLIFKLTIPSYESAVIHSLSDQMRYNYSLRHNLISGGINYD